MYVKIFQRLLLLCGVLALISCGGDSNSGPQPRLLTVQGQVIGPLWAASVTVTDADGQVFGPQLTDHDGSFSIEVTDPRSPLLVRSQGGQLNSIYPFQGELRNYCTAQESDSTLTCNITPYSTLIALLAESEVSQGEPLKQAAEQAQQSVFDLFKLAQDPFVADNAAPGSVPTHFFDLAAASSAINNNGSGLAGWLADMAAWVDTPFVGSAPAGTPVYRVRLERKSENGSIAPVNPADPAYTVGSKYIDMDVAMGQTAQFIMLADTHYEANASGCGGSLVGTTYTTAPIVSASKASGVCKVEVRFAAEQYKVTYEADLNGSIAGKAVQLVQYNIDPAQAKTDEVEAIANVGFEFAQWSDGVLTAKRSDNITADFTVTAQFQPKQLTLTYLAGPGGTLTGDSVQNILYGESGTSVTAVANAGYQFDRWSDGYTIALRNDVDVKADKTFTAKFVQKPDAVPWSQGLHGGDISVQVVGPRKAIIDWQETGHTYDLYITDDPDTVLEEYAVFDATLMTAVTAPLELDNLTPEQSLYLALMSNGELIGWTTVVPRSWGLDGEVLSQTVDQDGNRFVAGNFTRALQNTGAGMALPSADLPLAAVHGLPFADVDGVIYAITDDGAGGWYIGGQFSTVNGEPRENLARIDRLGNVVLDWDASVTGPSAVVKALARSDAGQLLVGGRFDSATAAGAASRVRKNVALFNNNGELNEDFKITANGEVRAISLNSDAAFIGGSFSVIGDGVNQSVPAVGLGFIRLSSGTVMEIEISVAGSVNVLQQANSGLLIGGDFTSFIISGEEKQQNLLAILDDTFSLDDRSWNFTGPSGQAVNTVVIDGDKILVGGSFTGIDGAPRVGLAELDVSGNLLPARFAVDGVVNALLVSGTQSDRRIYAAGDFSSASGNGLPEQQRNAVAAFNGAGDLLDWQPDLVGTVKALVLRKYTVSAGTVDEASYRTLAAVGDLQGISSATARTRLAAFDDQGSLLPWSPAANNDVLALTIHNDTVYAGGRFTLMGDQQADTDRDYLAAIDRNTGLLSAWDPSADGEVRTLLNEAGVIYAGGDFAQVGGVARSNLAAIDLMGNTLAWDPAANDRVEVLLADNGIIYAGGDFTEAGGTARAHLAAFDTDTNGTLLAWNPAVNGPVHSLVALAGDIYVGGDFSQAGSTASSRSYLAAFDALGDLLGWDPQANGVVRGLAQDQGVIYTVGDFTEVATEARQGVAALDASATLQTWYPAEFAPGQARSVQASGGVIAVSGGFTRLRGNAMAARSGLVLFDDIGELLSH